MGMWTREQAIIALEFYYQCPENMHTDSHPNCKEVATLIGRKPSALDSILRNIKYVDTGEAGLAHASQIVRSTFDEFKDNKPALLAEAARIREANGWPSLDCSE